MRELLNRRSQLARPEFTSKMARRATRKPVAETPAETAPSMPEDDFVASLRQELVKTQRSVAERPGEDLSHRAGINQRLLQDLWEVHNQFEEISVHLTMEPSQTLFATFVEYPDKWSFRETFDFGAVKTIELKDRSPGWLGSTLRFWYYKTPEGKNHYWGPRPLVLHVYMYFFCKVGWS